MYVKSYLTKLMITSTYINVYNSYVYTYISKVILGSGNLLLQLLPHSQSLAHTVSMHFHKSYATKIMILYIYIYVYIIAIFLVLIANNIVITKF